MFNMFNKRGLKCFGILLLMLMICWAFAGIAGLVNRFDVAGSLPIDNVSSAGLIASFTTASSPAQASINSLSVPFPTTNYTSTPAVETLTGSPCSALVEGSATSTWNNSLTSTSSIATAMFSSDSTALMLGNPTGSVVTITTFITHTMTDFITANTFDAFETATKTITATIVFTNAAEVETTSAIFPRGFSTAVDGYGIAQITLLGTSGIFLAGRIYGKGHAGFGFDRKLLTKSDGKCLFFLKTVLSS